MLRNLGLVLLTASEPKTGQSQTGMGGLRGVEEKEEAVAPQLFAMRPLPFPVMKLLRASAQRGGWTI